MAYPKFIQIAVCGADDPDVYDRIYALDVNDDVWMKCGNEPWYQLDMECQKPEDQDV